MSKRVSELHFQADQIESVLASHRIHGRVTGGAVTPQMVRFHLAPALGTRVSQIARLSEELALSLGAATCRVVRRGTTIDLEFPRSDRGIVRLFDLSHRLPRVPAATAILGLDGEGTPILLRLASPEVPHVLISGTTGSGKTALARSMIAGLATHNSPADLGLLLIDPKGRGYAPFASLPHLLAPVAQTPQDAIALLEWLVGEMERRDHEGVTLPRIVTFIDELADLALVGGATVTAALTRLSQRGREAGLHMVACTQKPSASVIGSLVKANFPARLVGSVASAEDAKVASGIARSGADRLAGRGDFLLIVQGMTHRFQAAYCTEAELAEHLGLGEAPLPLAATPRDAAAHVTAVAPLQRRVAGVSGVPAEGRPTGPTARPAEARRGAQLRLVK